MPVPPRPRLVLLDVDDVLLGWRKRDVIHELTGARSLPAPPVDARKLVFPGHEVAWIRPSTLRYLRAVKQAGATIVWNTSWLAHRDQLVELSRTLRLSRVVRFPAHHELAEAPQRTAIETSHPGMMARHWKIRTLALHLEELNPDAEVVIVDDHLAGGEHQLRAMGAGFIVPRGGDGLSPADASKLLRWARGGPLPQRSWFRR